MLEAVWLKHSDLCCVVHEVHGMTCCEHCVRVCAESCRFSVRVAQKFRKVLPNLVQGPFSLDCVVLLVPLTKLSLALIYIRVRDVVWSFVEPRADKDE